MGAPSHRKRRLLNRSGGTDGRWAATTVARPGDVRPPGPGAHRRLDRLRAVAGPVDRAAEALAGRDPELADQPGSPALPGLPGLLRVRTAADPPPAFAPDPCPRLASGAAAGAHAHAGSP